MVPCQIFLDLTHLWCSGPDHYPEGDEIEEAPVVGDYGWGQLDQGVEPVIGEPAP